MSSQVPIEKRKPEERNGKTWPDIVDRYLPDTLPKTLVNALIYACVFFGVFWFCARFHVFDNIIQLTTPTPKDAIIAFVGKQCPTGWESYTRGEGRYIVGLNPGGKLEAEIGFKLKDLDNFPAGKHTHGYLDFVAGGGKNVALADGGSYGRYDTPRITEPNANAPEGTNAPYVQLLLCRKT